MEIQGQEIRMAINPNERFNRITVGGSRAANRNRTQGSGKLAGTTNPVYKANLARQNSNNNFANLIGAGAGLLTAGKDPGYQAQEYADQQLLSEKVLGLTTPPIKGIGYNNTYNPDTGFQSTLTEDNQNLYDQSGNIAGMFGQQIMDYGSGGFEAMEQRRLERMRALTSEDNERRAQQIRERNLNTGASSYGVMQGQLAENNYLNQQDLGYQNNAFSQAIQGGEYLSGQRTGAQNSMLAAADPANTMLANQMTKVNATGNLTALSKSGTMLADQQAAAAEAKSKGKNKFWNSVLKMGGNAISPGLGTIASGLFT